MLFQHKHFHRGNSRDFQTCTLKFQLFEQTLHVTFQNGNFSNQSSRTVNNAPRIIPSVFKQNFSNQELKLTIFRTYDAKSHCQENPDHFAAESFEGHFSPFCLTNAGFYRHLHSFYFSQFLTKNPSALSSFFV